AEEALLRRGFCELAAERLARVGERMLHQVFLLATLRDQHFHAAAALHAERFADQHSIGHVVRHEDATRRRLIVVKLSDERAEHVLGSERAVGAREICAVAPVLSGAEEEYFDTREAAFLMQREHIGLFDAARIDALVRLNRGERREAIAVDGGALEIEG